VASFTHRRTADADDVVGALTTAHLGLLALSFGDVRRAERAGGYLARLLGSQPDLDHGLHLRADSNGRVVDDFPAEAAVFHLVSRTQPDQAYFMLGYPIAFLARLAELTGDRGHLSTAHEYLDFALSCGGKPALSALSHKVASGAAVLGRVTQAPHSLALAEQITAFLLEIQDASGAAPGSPRSRLTRRSTRPPRSPYGCRRSPSSSPAPAPLDPSGLTLKHA
jgi:hypothetical protein